MTYHIGVIGTGFVGTAVSTGLDQVLRKKVQILEYDKFKPSESLDVVLDDSDILFVCLPTPMNFDTGQCDLSIVRSVLSEINGYCAGKSIVLKSTVPPGTTKEISKQYPRHNFVFCPEFLTEKNFIKDFLEQDRIILGTTSDYVGFDNEVMDLFIDFIAVQKKSGILSQIHIVDSSVAEMVKYMGNCILASKVAFCNEMEEICKASDIDYSKVSELVSLDKRIGSSHIKVPGPDGKHGFGGSCFSKDINALITFAKDRGVDPIMLETAWTKNLLVREEYEWEKLPQVNGKYSKK
jgi:nucleotide sugar dehydrogenase